MTKEKLTSGIYICPECESEFEVTREKCSQLVCDDCNEPLELVDEEEEE